MDHQHLLQSLWRRQHSIGSTGSSFGSTESSIDSTTSAYSASSSTTTNTQLPILQEEDPFSMELSPGAGSSSANGTPSPTFCLFPSNLFSATPGLSASPLLQSDSSSSSMITPPPSYQAALLSSLKVPELDQLAELAALLNSAAAQSAAASLLAQASLIPPPLPTTQPPRDDLMPLDLSTKQSHTSALLAPAHLLQRPSNGSCSSTSSTSAVQSVRPSVILDGTNLRRSSSSITASSRSIPDVNEHFRRSLSGKWPRRVPSLDDRRPISTPFRRPPSTQSSASRSSPAPSCNNNNTIVITTNSNETIEDYFRRALGVEEFEEWKRSREEIEDRKRREREGQRF